MYAMQNPGSYVHSNIAGFVNLLEVCKSVNPQPAIVWASSSSVYELNNKVSFSEKDRTDQPTSLYAATKKAGEEIAHTYYHIYGLSLTGLRFFTVYGPWGRPDMAYFFFTKDILKGKPIPVFEVANHGTVARDFTYIDDIVRGCLGALDTAEKSTGSGGKKRGPTQLRVFNLGSTSPMPVNELVSILERLLKVKAKRNIMKLPRNGDVQFTHANISYAQRELGYNLQQIYRLVCMVQPKAEMDLQFESTKLSTPLGYLSAIALSVTTIGNIALMSGFFIKPDATLDDYLANVIATRVTAARYGVKPSPSFLVPSNWTRCLGVMNNYESILRNSLLLLHSWPMEALMEETMHCYGKV
ncbi:unnamed protein product [Lupinus luteus]|uniref:NAD-dependent epimerase/dehydratase domain-containing protein n=1 Tax=Lupinus luteus TaxID=3873 RepID=A0AAV1Y3P0_LUPLU